MAIQTVPACLSGLTMAASGPISPSHSPGPKYGRRCGHPSALYCSARNNNRGPYNLTFLEGGTLAAKLTAAGRQGNRVLPVLYTGNYVTVMPGEPRRVDIRCPAGAECSRIQIRGWNAEPATISIAGP